MSSSAAEGFDDTFASVQRPLILTDIALRGPALPRGNHTPGNDLLQSLSQLAEEPHGFTRPVFVPRGNHTPGNDLLQSLSQLAEGPSGLRHPVFLPRMFIFPTPVAEHEPLPTQPNFLKPLTETSEYDDEHADEWLQMLQSKDCSNAPREFVCPISLDIMQNPVCAQDGHTYERREIVQWLRRNHKSPKTLLDMGNHLVDNLALKSMIAEWLEGAPRAQPAA